MNHANIQKLHVVGHITGRLRDKLPDWTMSKRNLHLLLLAVLLTGCQMNTFTRKHFPERVAQIHTVALLPQVHTAMLDTYFGMDSSPASLPEERSRGKCSGTCHRNPCDASSGLRRQQASNRAQPAHHYRRNAHHVWRYHALQQLLRVRARQKFAFTKRRCTSNASLEGEG